MSQEHRTINKNRTQFPRTKELPIQSSKYWAKEKYRYLRQLLISDLREETGREVIVYFAQLNEGIDHTDSDDISEIIDGLQSYDVDIIIQTPGGLVDAVEKIILLLRCRLDSYRVIVPGWAKSGGTAIALSSEEILLGVNSELGPIDPQMPLSEYHGLVPCEFVSQDKDQPWLIRKMAESHVERMKALAKKALRDGMLADKEDKDLDRTIKKISSSDSYKSHNAVIDYSEAESLGLKVSWLKPESRVWRLVWLLHCCYDYDAKIKQLGKIIEGEKYSIARRSS